MKINCIQHRDLSFYSFRQTRERSDEDISQETFLNKVTIKPNADEDDGYEILIYRAVNDKFELCNGLRQNEILSDSDEETWLQGKGYSANGIRLCDRAAYIKWNDGYPDLKLKKKNINDSNTYHNCLGNLIVCSSIGEDDINSLMDLCEKLSICLPSESSFFYPTLWEVLLAVRDWLFNEVKNSIYEETFAVFVNGKTLVLKLIDHLNWLMDGFAYDLYNKRMTPDANYNLNLKILSQLTVIDLFLKTFLYKEKSKFSHDPLRYL